MQLVVVDKDKFMSLTNAVYSSHAPGAAAAAAAAYAVRPLLFCVPWTVPRTRRPQPRSLALGTWPAQVRFH